MLITIKFPITNDFRFAFWLFSGEIINSSILNAAKINKALSMNFCFLKSFFIRQPKCNCYQKKEAIARSQHRELLMLIINKHAMEIKSISTMIKCTSEKITSEWYPETIIATPQQTDGWTKEYQESIFGRLSVWAPFSPPPRSRPLSCSQGRAVGCNGNKKNNNKIK